MFPVPMSYVKKSMTLIYIYRVSKKLSVRSFLKFLS